MHTRLMLTLFLRSPIIESLSDRDMRIGDRQGGTMKIVEGWRSARCLALQRDG